MFAEGREVGRQGGREAPGLGGQRINEVGGGPPLCVKVPTWALGITLYPGNGNHRKVYAGGYKISFASGSSGCDRGAGWKGPRVQGARA